MRGSDLQVAPVDLIDYLQVSRKQMSKQVHRPALQGFRQDGVVGVCTGAHADIPSLSSRKKKRKAEQAM